MSNALSSVPLGSFSRVSCCDWNLSLLVTEHDVPERNQTARAAAAASRPQEQQLARVTDSTLARPGAESQSWRVHAGRSRKAHGQHIATLEAWAWAQEPTGEDGHEGQARQP